MFATQQITVDSNTILHKVIDQVKLKAGKVNVATKSLRNRQAYKKYRDFPPSMLLILNLA